MRKITISLLLFFIITRSISQSITTKIDTYQIPNQLEGVGLVSIKMPYGKSTPLLISGDTASLRNAGDILIDIICTDFPSSSSLRNLNINRIQQFYKLFPFIDSSQVNKIEIFRQMHGDEKDKALNMFHGLVIKFRPRQSKETIIQDLSKIDELLSQTDVLINKSTRVDNLIKTEKKEVKKAVVTIDESFSKLKDTIDIHKKLRSKTLKNREWGQISAGGLRPLYFKDGHDSTCFLVISPNEALKKGIITKKDYKGEGRTGPHEYSIGLKAHDTITIWICTQHFASLTTLIEEADNPLQIDSTSTTNYKLNPEKYSLPDSTLHKIFVRNRWVNMDIVSDVTGSMYPYTAQLLLWLKLQSLDSLTNYYSFFNDGNETPDRKKKIGKTGGIYSKTCTSFSDVLDLVKSTMGKGGGGDCPENNIEALLEAEKKFPETNFHVLIADNWAPIKDLSLVKTLTKPVRVVICGVFNNAVNTQYLDLARITGGSLHLIENDLLNLAAMHEGEVLRIGRKEYKIVNGVFREVNESFQKDYRL